MEIAEIEERLLVRGLAHPSLNALEPNEAMYSVALYQPCGLIEVGDDGVQVTDAEQKNRAAEFLELAREKNVDLAVSPEYSMPVDTLLEKLKAETSPEAGVLWVLGCEAIPLAQINEQLSAFEECAEVVSEELSDTRSEKFVNPVAYVFRTESLAGDGQKLVVVFQYKTKPMADRANFEVSGMKNGTNVYRFGTGHQVRLLTLICSDALGLSTETLNDIYEGALIIHLQLNEGYRDGKFRLYRDALFAPECDHTELICLNWASPVEAAGSSMDKLGGSGWYLRPSQFDSSDEAIDANHGGGLYYTWFAVGRAHALFLNRASGVYLYTASKVRHHGVEVVGAYRRSGPRAEAFLTWNSEETKWVESTPDSGFSDYSSQLGTAESEIVLTAEASPIKVERIVNLSIGHVRSEDWFKPEKLQSFLLEQGEQIFCFTYCQDDDEDTQAGRESAFLRVAELQSILNDPAALPIAVRDLADSGKFDWSSDSPHQNLVGEDGRATAVYLSDAVAEARIESLGLRLQQFLFRSAEDAQESRRFHQRLVLFHRSGSEVTHWSPDTAKVDDPDILSPVDFGNER